MPHLDFLTYFSLPNWGGYIGLLLLQWGPLYIVPGMMVNCLTTLRGNTIRRRKGNMNGRICVGLSIAAFLLASFAIACGSECGHSSLQMAQAHTEHAHGAIETGKETVSGKAVNVGNKICPVSGEKIVEKLKATYEYNGKVYNFCCPACIGEFKKDPQKYIKKVEAELQATSESQSKHEKHGMEMMHGAGTSHEEMQRSHPL